MVGQMENAVDPNRKNAYVLQLAGQFKQAMIIEVVFGKLTIVLGLVILAFEPSECTRGKAVFPTICFFFGVVWLLTACNYYCKYKELRRAQDLSLAGQDTLPVAAVALPEDGPGAVELLHGEGRGGLGRGKDKEKKREAWKVGRTRSFFGDAVSSYGGRPCARLGGGAGASQK